MIKKNIKNFNIEKIIKVEIYKSAIISMMNYES